MIPKFFLKRRHAAMHIWDLMHIDRNIKNQEDVAKRRMCLFGRRKQPFFDNEVEEDN